MGKVVTCHGCGVEKDMDELEPLPRYGISEMDPIVDLDVEPTADAYNGGEWRKASVCLGCFERLDPDMWISQRCWESLAPPAVIVFDDLPFLEEE